MASWSENIRAKSPSAKRKIVWLATCVSMIFIFILWGLLNQPTIQRTQAPSEPLFLKEIIKEAKKAGELNTKLDTTITDAKEYYQETVKTVQEIQSRTSSTTGTPVQ